MNSYQLRDAKIVRDHNTIKAPFLPQNVVEEMLVAVRRNSVYLVVRCHHALNVPFFHSRFERLKKIFADYAF